MNSTEQACKQLCKSHRGQVALRELVTHFTDGGWASLDGPNQEAIITLLRGAWGPTCMSTRETMEEYWNGEDGV